MRHSRPNRPPSSRTTAPWFPCRAIFEALGAEVEWDDATRSITATRDDKTIEMTIGQTEMTVDGEAVTLEVAPTILNNTTLVPVRAVAESFDAQVGWNEANRRGHHQHHSHQDAL